MTTDPTQPTRPTQPRKTMKLKLLLLTLPFLAACTTPADSPADSADVRADVSVWYEENASALDEVSASLGWVSETIEAAITTGDDSEVISACRDLQFAVLEAQAADDMPVASAEAEFEKGLQLFLDAADMCVDDIEGAGPLFEKGSEHIGAAADIIRGL